MLKYCKTKIHNSRSDPSSINNPYTVYKGHKRIIDFVEDSCRTWANIVDNFIPGEVYNVGSRPEWEMDIKGYSDLILKAVGRDDSIVTHMVNGYLELNEPTT